MTTTDTLLIDPRHNGPRTSGNGFSGGVTVCGMKALLSVSVSGMACNL